MLWEICACASREKQVYGANTRRKWNNEDNDDDDNGDADDAEAVWVAGLWQCAVKVVSQ